MFPTLDLPPEFIRPTDARQALTHADHCSEGFLRIRAGRNTQPFAWTQLFWSLSLPSSRQSSSASPLWNSSMPTNKSSYLSEGHWLAGMWIVFRLSYVVIFSCVLDGTLLGCFMAGGISKV